MNSPRFKREFVLYGLAFLLALTLRLVRLGAFPLTDSEAAAALQALEVVRGLREGIGPHSLYVLLTSAFFFPFDSTNFFARLAPALTGSLLVFVPMLFQHRLKPRQCHFGGHLRRRFGRAGDLGHTRRDLFGAGMAQPLLAAEMIGDRGDIGAGLGRKRAGRTGGKAVAAEQMQSGMDQGGAGAGGGRIGVHVAI